MGDEEYGGNYSPDSTNIAYENRREVVLVRNTLELRVGINQQGEDGESVLRLTARDVIKRPAHLPG